MKIRKLTNEEIKGACAFAVSIYNIAIRGCFRTQDCHRYFDEYMDADRLTDEERTGVLVVFGAFDSNVLCGVCGMTNEGHITMLYVHPQYLRRGIGKKLLERVRIYARMQLKLMQVSVNAMPATPGISFFSRKSCIVPSQRKLLGIRDSSLTIYPSGHGLSDSISGVIP